jgi:hypothetical protein
MRALVFAILAGTASAQTLVSPAGIPVAEKSFAPPGEPVPLLCNALPVKPTLNFSLRFQAGYRLVIPLSQYRGGTHTLNITVRITPAGGAPVYLADHATLVAGTHPDAAAAEINGGYMLGEGRYHAELALSDETGATCRKDWQISAVKDASRPFDTTAMAAGQVADLSYQGNHTVSAPAGPAVPLSLTILLNRAVPFRAENSPVSDAWADYRKTLADLLESLVLQMPGTAIRLVVFDLDRRIESLRQDGFTLADMPKAEHAIADPEHDVASVKDLQNQAAAWPFLKDLVHQEALSPNQSSTVLFLGAKIGMPGDPPAHFLDSEKQDGLRLLYLQYWPDKGPFDRPAGACGVAKRGDPPCFKKVKDSDDAIALTVLGLNGKVTTVRWASDFIKLLDSLKHP